MSVIIRQATIPETAMELEHFEVIQKPVNLPRTFFKFLSIQLQITLSNFKNLF